MLRRDLQSRPTPKPISTSATPLPLCHLDRSVAKWRDLRSRPTPKPISPSATPLPLCHLDRSGEICGSAPPQTNLNLRNPPPPLSSRPKWRDLQSRSTPKPISTSATRLPLCHLDRSGEICSSRSFRRDQAHGRTAGFRSNDRSSACTNFVAPSGVQCGSTNGPPPDHQRSGPTIAALLHYVRHSPGHHSFYLPQRSGRRCYPLARSFLLPTCPVRTLYQGTTLVGP